MAGLHVNAEEMRARGESTIREGESLENQINNLKTTMQELMNIWNGPAAQSFQSAVDEQVVNLNEFRTLIGTLGDAIVKGAESFDENESDNAARAANLF